VALASSPLATTASAPDAVAMYPNPASGQVTLRLPRAATGSAQATLLDLRGRQVLTQTLPLGAETTIQLPASLAAGVYLLQVQGPGLVMKPQRLEIR
jgi:hypothetical protein